MGINFVGRLFIFKYVKGGFHNKFWGFLWGLLFCSFGTRGAFLTKTILPLFLTFG